MPTRIADTMMYSSVHKNSEPRMPIGMSFCGFLASCAAVETASNPMYAKNTTPAARAIPDHPNDPKLPVFDGRNVAQFVRAMSGCWMTYAPATTMNVMTAISFTNTM